MLNLQLGYDRRESRQEYRDRITQMGHEPDQYEQWQQSRGPQGSKEKEAWPGAWGEKTTKQQFNDRKGTGRAVERKLDGN